MRLKRFEVAAIGVMIVAAFFLAPVVTYTKSFALPFALENGANHVCAEEAFGKANPPSTSVFPNATLEAEWNAYNACLGQHLYPPYNLTGHASLAYWRLGVGSPPFPTRYNFTQGNYTGLVYFDGTMVTAAYEFSQKVSVDPEGIFALLNASAQLTGYGDLQFSASVKNIGNAPITGLNIGASGLPAPYGTQNMTKGGVDWTWVGGFECSPYLMPGNVCTTTIPLSITNRTQFHYFVYVSGAVGGTGFFHRQEFVQPTPQPGANQGWVSLFMDRINSQRVGPPLTENSTLDRFAQQRFATASSNPQISDYGYWADLSSFFGPGASTSNDIELLLFPGNSAPYPYIADLQGGAPEHFAALMNSTYIRFGYFIGQAPYYLVNSGCPVTEISTGGINITQYFQGYGCTVTRVPDQNWLVIILGR